MNALIFAAGLGTRLKPLTDTMPKAMVPVNGKPLVQILIEKLKSIGVTEIVINVHHFAQQIIDFVEANDSFGIDIKFSDETDMLLETGGGLKKAARLFSNDKPILVHNVDILSNADLLSLYNNATSTTLLVSQRNTQRYLLFDKDDRLVGWTNIATGEVKSPFPSLSLAPHGFMARQILHHRLLPLHLRQGGHQVSLRPSASIARCGQTRFHCQSRRISGTTVRELGIDNLRRCCRRLRRQRRNLLYRTRVKIRV